MHSAPRPSNTRIPRPVLKPPPRWDALLIVTGALLLVAQARVHVFVPGLSSLRPGLLLLVAGIGIWLFQKDPLGRLGRPLPFGTRLGLFILAWAAIGVPFSLWVGQSARGVVESFLVTIVVFLMVTAAPRHLQDVRRLLMAFAVGGSVFAIIAPLRGGLSNRGFAGGGYDPNDSAMYLVSALPILVFFAMSLKRTVGRFVSGIAALAALMAIVATQSRGGFLGLAAVLLFMLLFFRGIRTGAKVLVVGVFCIGLAFTADAGYWERMESITDMSDGYDNDEGSVEGRINIWKRGAGYLAANPLTGVGLYNFPVAEGQSEVIASRIRRGIGTKYSAAHSMWVQVAAELGVPGIAAFIMLFGHVGSGMWRISKGRSQWPQDRDVAFMASTILASIVGVAVAGSFLSNAYWAMVWAPLGLGVALIRLEALDRRSRGLGFDGRPARTGGARSPRPVKLEHQNAAARR